MRVLRTFIYIEVAEQLGTETVLRKHSLDGMLHDKGRLAIEHFFGRSETLATRITGMADVHLVGQFLSRETDLLGVDDDDVVTTVGVGSEIRFVLAAEDKSDAGSETTQHLIGRINNVPLFLCGGAIGGNGLVA